MLSLIGREIRDHIVFVLAQCVFALLMIVLAIRAFLSDVGMAFLVPVGLLMCLPLLIFCFLGATQMYGDRAHKVSALLGTLAVTRNQILAARVLVGVLTITATIVPPVVAILVLMRLLVPGAELWYRMVGEMSVTLALTGLASYCVGLLVGWTTSRVWLIAGNLLLLLVIVSLVYIKGFGPEVMGVLLLVITAALLRVWHTFTSASL
jgi:ABC-type transport system involved in multi-copper enzyme maturation permease subunit